MTLKIKRVAEHQVASNQAPREQRSSGHMNSTDSVDAWRKGRNQDFVRDAHALSSFAKQSKEVITKSRQSWLEQRAKYESHILYEARRQLDLMSEDAHPKAAAAQTTTTAATPQPLKHEPSAAQIKTSASHQTHAWRNLSPASTSAVAAHDDHHSSRNAKQLPATLRPPPKSDTLDGLGEAIARIESLMKHYTKPLSGSLSGSVPVNGLGIGRNGVSEKQHSGENTTVQLPHVPQSYCAPSTALTSLHTTMDEDVCRSRAQGQPHLGELDCESGQAVGVGESLASTWRDIGELGSRDLTSLATMHRHLT